MPGDFLGFFVGLKPPDLRTGAVLAPAGGVGGFLAGMASYLSFPRVARVIAPPFMALPLARPTAGPDLVITFDPLRPPL